MKKPKQDTASQRFANKLRWLRHQKPCGMDDNERPIYPSQRSVAKSIGVSYRLYWGWERGANATLDSLDKVADFYGVDVKELL